jgi:hypothetical protein
MTCLRPHRVGKAESLFAANRNPFSTASVRMRKAHVEQMFSALPHNRTFLTVIGTSGLD